MYMHLICKFGLLLYRFSDPGHPASARNPAYLSKLNDMQPFWDERYLTHDHVYGKGPNAYFKSVIDTLEPGTLLLPAEGEGRNALYAASRGWVVEAFDFSGVAREKALRFAKEAGVNIRYDQRDIATFTAEKQYDLIGLLYVHLPETLRKKFHHEIYRSVKPGGLLVLEAFAKEQVRFSSGGPSDPALLYDAPSICQDFPFLHLMRCEQKETILEEGAFHLGQAAVLRLTGQRL